MLTQVPGELFRVTASSTMASASSIRVHPAMLGVFCLNPVQARWTWASMNPGSTVAPCRSITSRAGREVTASSRPTIRPCQMPRSWATGWSGSMVRKRAFVSLVLSNSGVPPRELTGPVAR